MRPGFEITVTFDTRAVVRVEENNAGQRCRRGSSDGEMAHVELLPALIVNNKVISVDVDWQAGDSTVNDEGLRA